MNTIDEKDIKPLAKGPYMISVSHRGDFDRNELVCTITVPKDFSYLFHHAQLRGDRRHVIPILQDLITQLEQQGELKNKGLL